MVKVVQLKLEHQFLPFIYFLTPIETNIFHNSFENFFSSFQNDKVKYVDLGGAYVGPTQNRLLRMAREFNVKTFFTNEKEDLVMFHKVNYDNKGILSLANYLVEPEMKS